MSGHRLGGGHEHSACRAASGAPDRQYFRAITRLGGSGVSIDVNDLFSRDTGVVQRPLGSALAAPAPAGSGCVELEGIGRVPYARRDRVHDGTAPQRMLSRL